ncbi:mitochondrial ribosomal death-associated protein 3-domain-containing protein [Mycena filopes]|nr:mitochondrial ribosomal death-associated protein 3-domain-containing protein [Mycena filopes]
MYLLCRGRAPPISRLGVRHYKKSKVKIGGTGEGPRSNMGGAQRNKRAVESARMQLAVMNKDNADAEGGGKGTPRDAQGRPIVKEKEKSLGAFRAMGAGGLTHPIFESGPPGRVELDLPVLEAGGIAGPGGLTPGTVVRFRDEDPASPLRVYGVPKSMLVEFRILGAPMSVITATTLSLVRLLHESALPLPSARFHDPEDDPDDELPITRPNARIVLNGRAGTGKSFLLLQLAEYAAALRTAANQREWIVIYVPRARALVNGSTPAVYSLQTQTYHQPRAAWNLLSRIGRANRDFLEVLATTQEWHFDVSATPGAGAGAGGVGTGAATSSATQASAAQAAGESAGLGHVKPGTPLTALIDLAVSTPDPAAPAETTIDYALAPFVLDALLEELAAQTRFPVLLAIDEVQALAGRSMYKDPQFKGIRPHHLGMPRLLLEFIGGRRGLARGLVLTALSRSDPTFPVPPQFAAALNLSDEFTSSPRSVRERRSSQLAAYLEGEVVVDYGVRGVELDLGDYPEPWTGYRAYDPPTYEDSPALQPTAATPEPPLRPVDLWRDKVMKREEEELEEEMDALAEQAELEEAALAVSSDAPPLDGEAQPKPAQDGKQEPTEEEEDDDDPGPVDTSSGTVSAPLRLTPAEKATLAAQKRKAKKEKARERAKEREMREGLVLERAVRAVRVPDALGVREAAALFEVWLDVGVLRTGGERRRVRRAELAAVEDYATERAALDAATADDADLAEAEADEALAALQEEFEAREAELAEAEEAEAEEGAEEEDLERELTSDIDTLASTTTPSTTTAAADATTLAAPTEDDSPETAALLEAQETAETARQILELEDAFERDEALELDEVALLEQVVGTEGWEREAQGRREWMEETAEREKVRVEEVLERRALLKEEAAKEARARAEEEGLEEGEEGVEAVEGEEGTEAEAGIKAEAEAVAPAEDGVEAVEPVEAVEGEAEAEAALESDAEGEEVDPTAHLEGPTRAVLLPTEDGEYFDGVEDAKGVVHLRGEDGEYFPVAAEDMEDVELVYPDELEGEISGEDEGEETEGAMEDHEEEEGEEYASDGELVGSDGEELEEGMEEYVSDGELVGSDGEQLEEGMEEYASDGEEYDSDIEALREYAGLEDGEDEGDTDDELAYGSDHDELPLPEDNELAALVSQGVREAMEDPETTSELLRAPTSWAEDVDGIDGVQMDSLRKMVMQDIGEDGQVRVKLDEDGNPILQRPGGRMTERETGADELFLGKYAESSGNARAFVWGGLLATLQTAK